MKGYRKKYKNKPKTKQHSHPITERSPIQKNNGKLYPQHKTKQTNKQKPINKRP